MWKTSLAIVMAAVAGAAWWSVHSDEQVDAAKPQAINESASKPANEKKDDAGKGAANGEDKQDEPVKAIVSGKVVALEAALKQRGIKSYAEEIKGQVVLVTRTGELIPIVPDWRGRAFYQDERLRDRPVDLVVYRRKGVPWVQVLSIYTFDEQGVRSITDYWCDICAIPMFEIKDCECCQGPTQLRLRPQELPKDVAPAEGVEKSKAANDK
jgi:hypothetical protein